MSTNKEEVEKTGLLIKIASVSWVGVGFATVAGLLGIPYLLFYSHLPESVQFWLSPRILLALIVVLGIAAAAILQRLFSKDQHNKRL